MGDPDASSGEMARFMFPSRPGRELGEPLLDALLEGRSLPPDAPGEFCAVAEMLADLAGPAEPGELAGEAAARLGLTRTASPAGVSPVAHRSARRRRSRISVPVTARLGTALIVAAVGLGGVSAAYAGALPGPLQNIAHRLFGAPPERHADLLRPRPGPDTSGPGRSAPRPAAHGAGKRHAGKHPGRAHGKAKGHAKLKSGKAPPGQAKKVKQAKKPKKPKKPKKAKKSNAKGDADVARARHPGRAKHLAEGRVTKAGESRAARRACRTRTAPRGVNRRAADPSPRSSSPRS
jgi:hypothetical protein